jgi:4-hydroxy-4-methyl-2-oxoglutarate aldolase
VVPNQQPTAGYALTVKQMVRSVNRTETSLAKHGMVIDTMLKAGDVLVVDVGGRMDVCTGGALLALRAKNVGSQGFIINGCMRDLDDIAKIGFPVYLKGGCPIKSSPMLETVGINVPVQIGDTQVCPGDLIVMDPTGIIVIPVDRMEEIYEAAVKTQIREDRYMKFVEHGGTVADAIKSES